MWTLKEKKMTRMNVYAKQRLTDTENKLMVTKGEWGWGMDKLGG